MVSGSQACCGWCLRGPRWGESGAPGVGVSERRSQHPRIWAWGWFPQNSTRTADTWKGEGAAAEKDLLPEDEMRAAHPITSRLQRSHFGGYR